MGFNSGFKGLIFLHKCQKPDGAIWTVWHFESCLTS